MRTYVRTSHDLRMRGGVEKETSELRIVRIMAHRRSSIALKGHVAKDSQGFDDLDAFWNASGKKVKQ